jgi:hypothetical protein
MFSDSPPLPRFEGKQNVNILPIVCASQGISMPTPNEQLRHLLELAAQGAGERAALAGELAELLLAWPASYPVGMRATFEALLERILHETDLETRAVLAPRFADRDDFPLSLLNAFFLSAPPAMRAALLARNDAAGATGTLPIDCEALLETARNAGDLGGALVRFAALPEMLAEAIACDGGALAILCKGGGVGRAMFSAIAILAGAASEAQQIFAVLAAYDDVPADGAAQLVAFWQRRGPQAPILDAADAA